MKFAPLHLISGYSFLQSGLTIEKIAQSVKNFDYFGAGLSDYNVMYGVPSFYNAIQKINKKPLIGITINLDDNYLSLYAKNEEGYLSLSELSSSIQKGKMDLSLIKKEGLIGILDTHNSKIYENFKENISCFGVAVRGVCSYRYNKGKRGGEQSAFGYADGLYKGFGRKLSFQRIYLQLGRTR
jgi:DNA polymerase III alpha subunit